MKSKTKSAIITGMCAIISAVLSAVISVRYGENIGKNQVINEINDTLANVTGNNNVVTINDMSSFIDDYESTMQENEQIKNLNAQYVGLLAQNNEDIDILKTQVSDAPVIDYNDLALVIDGDEIAVNSNNSMVVIDSREYISKEIAEKLIDERKNIIYRDNTMYVGNIIADKKDLFEQWNVNSVNSEMKENKKDSYGNLHSKVLRFYYGSGNAIYNLNRNYSMVKLSIAIEDSAMVGYKGVITIKADDNVVYTSPNITKTTEPFTVSDIAINNCSLLTIEYSEDGVNAVNAIVYDAYVYN
jgi:hypothetical protein